jgi:hypothetical protein
MRTSPWAELTEQRAFVVDRSQSTLALYSRQRGKGFNAGRVGAFATVAVIADGAKMHRGRISSTRLASQRRNRLK